MKKLLLAGVTLATLCTGAMAADQVITIEATVAKFCSTTGVLTQTVDLTSQITNGIVAGTTASAPMGGILCNAAADVSLASANGGLYDPAVTTAAAPFRNRINYSAVTNTIAALVTQASVNANNATVTPAAISGVVRSTTGAFQALALGVDITPTVNTGSPILAGADYTDTLTLSIQPQP